MVLSINLLQCILLLTKVCTPALSYLYRRPDVYSGLLIPVKDQLSDDHILPVPPRPDIDSVKDQLSDYHILPVPPRPDIDSDNDDLSDDHILPVSRRPDINSGDDESRYDHTLPAYRRPSINSDGLFDDDWPESTTVFYSFFSDLEDLFSRIQELKRRLEISVEEPYPAVSRNRRWLWEDTDFTFDDVITLSNICPMEVIQFRYLNDTYRAELKKFFKGNLLLNKKWEVQKLVEMNKMSDIKKLEHQIYIYQIFTRVACVVMLIALLMMLHVLKSECKKNRSKTERINVVLRC